MTKVRTFTAALIAAFILLTAAQQALGALALPKMLEWFFLGGDDLAPASVMQTLMDSPHIIALYLLAAAFSILLMVGAFRLLLPRGMESTEKSWGLSETILSATAIYFIAFFILPLPFLAVLTPALKSLFGSESPLLNSRLSSMIFPFIGACFVFCTIFAVKKLFRGRARDLGFHRKGLAGNLLLGGLFFILLAPVITIVGHMSSLFFNGVGIGRQIQITITFLVQEDIVLFEVLLAFVAVVVAPIWEETFFRGFVLQGLKKRLGGEVAILASALIFAVGHTDSITVLPSIFAMGLVLGYLFERTGSLWLVIGFHAAFNARAIALLLLSKHGVI